MNKIVIRLLLSVFSLVLSVASFAQDTQAGADDLMRGNGKIYVVVAVCLTILIGLFAYVFAIDRKISKLEKGGS